MRPLRILIWHVHGSYLYYLTVRSPHQFFVPSKPERTGDYVGRWGHIPWGDNVHDIPAEKVRETQFDCIIYQTPGQYKDERWALLSAAQRSLPSIYIQHDPPWENPTEQAHWVDDPGVLLVHVTHFNQLMWDSRRTPTRVIEHGVLVPETAKYTGALPKGLVVINHLSRRGRRLGGDIYERVRQEVPLDLVGMAAEEMPGGLNEVLHAGLPAFEADYRFFFNPIRYTSLGLAVIEAMMIGLPIIGLATTEMAVAIPNGIAGWVDTRVDTLIARMKELIANADEARQLGEGARKLALERFNIDRFTSDWNDAFRQITT
ncbi:MAG: biosynthesis transferase [Verrucomicrobiaceae bacterium]|nr:biosynthesis transferase [Verrucomicrobiaceae bacterium]